MSGDICIQTAGREALYAIAALVNEGWKAEYRQTGIDAALDAKMTEARCNRFLTRYDEGASGFLKMTDGARLIGAAVFGRSFTEGYREDGEISALYLQADSIGRGYGHRLFTEAERALRAAGYDCFVLTVLTENVRALRFYLAHGYERAALRQIRLGITDYPLAVLRKRTFGV